MWADLWVDEMAGGRVEEMVVAWVARSVAQMVGRWALIQVSLRVVMTGVGWVERSVAHWAASSVARWVDEKVS